MRSKILLSCMSAVIIFLTVIPNQLIAKNGAQPEKINKIYFKSNLIVDLKNAIVYLENDQPQQVIKNLSVYSHQIEVDQRVLLLLGFSYQQLGKIESELEHIKKSAHLSDGLLRMSIDSITDNVDNPTRAGLYRQLDMIEGYNLLLNRKLELALSSAKSLIHKQPANPLAYHLLGLVYMAKGNYFDAKKGFNSALKLDDRFASARNCLADVLIKEKLYKEARKKLETALIRSPGDLRTLLLFAQLDEFEGRSQEAIQWLEKAILLHPNLIEPGVVLVGHYLRAKNLEGAVNTAEALQLKHTHDIRVLQLLGRLYLEETKEYNKAEKIFTQLNQIMPNNKNVLEGLARSYSGMGNKEKADHIINNAFALQP